MSSQSIYSRGSVFMNEHISTGSIKIATALTGTGTTVVAAKLPEAYHPIILGGLDLNTWAVIIPATATTLFTLWQMALLIPKTIRAIEEWKERRKAKKRR